MEGSSQSNVSDLTHADDPSSNEVTPQYLERLERGTFILPGEAGPLLFNVYCCLDNDLSEDAAQYWRLTDDDALLTSPADNWTPEDFTKNLNPKYVKVERRRRWWRNVLRSLHALASEHSIDERPLLWFSRWIEFGTSLSDSDHREIKDCVALLSMAVERGGVHRQEDERSTDSHDATKMRLDRALRDEVLVWLEVAPAYRHLEDEVKAALRNGDTSEKTTVLAKCQPIVASIAESWRISRQAQPVAAGAVLAPESPDRQSYTAHDIRTELRCGHSAFKTYREAAGIVAQGRRPFTSDQRLAILQQALKSSDVAISGNARRAIAGS